MHQSFRAIAGVFEQRFSGARPAARPKLPRGSAIRNDDDSGASVERDDGAYLVEDLLGAGRKVNRFLKLVADFFELDAFRPVVECTSDEDVGGGGGPGVQD
jgi:hypothetical protein